MVASAENIIRSQRSLNDANLEELCTYRDCLLSLLSKFTIGDCEIDKTQDLKAVYKLLGHIQASIEQQKKEQDQYPCS